MVIHAVSVNPGVTAINADRGGCRLARVLTRLAIGLSLAVILLGGWTRLSDAGLSCPDWPGCYGEWVLPSSEAGQAQAQARYQHLPLDLSRGWLEMSHRYLAGTLGLIIAAIALSGWRQRAHSNYPWGISLALLALVTLQALFGMWTVTLKLLPQIVTLHLLGGLVTLTLLLRLQQRLPRDSIRRTTTPGPGARSGIRVGLLVLLLQIMLGGWTSSNYAGWSCSHWWGCEADQVVVLDFDAGFSLPAINGTAMADAEGRTYQGGRLSREARAAIQMTHRVVGLLVALYLIALAVPLARQRNYRNTALLLVSLLAVQMLLGVLNVQLGLPRWLAFGHHATAVLLWVTLLRLYGLTEPALTGRGLT